MSDSSENTKDCIISIGDFRSVAFNNPSDISFLSPKKLLQLKSCFKIVEWENDLEKQQQFNMVL